MYTATHIGCQTQQRPPSRSGVAFKFTTPRTIFTKDLDNWFKFKHIGECYHSWCCHLAAVPSEGKMTSFLLLVGIYIYWTAKAPATFTVPMFKISLSSLGRMV